MKKEAIEQWVEKNCKCGLKESGVWAEEVFDRYGCNCYPKTKKELLEISI